MQPVEHENDDMRSKSIEYLDINEFDKGKLETSQGDFVLDEDDPFHALVTLLPGSCRTHHCLCDGLRARERV